MTAVIELHREPKGDWAIMSTPDDPLAVRFIKANMTLFGSRRAPDGLPALAIETGRISGLKAYAAKHGITIEEF